MSRKPIEFENHPYSFDEARKAGCYRAHCRHIVDGDTVDLLIDLGLRSYNYLPIRLMGYNAAELFKPHSPAELESARLAAETLATIILNKPVLVNTYKDGVSFDRFVGEIFVADKAMTSVAILMKQAGLEWSKKARRRKPTK